MAIKRISASVNEDLYEDFESLRQQQGTNRSQAVQQAIRLWLKHWDEQRMAEGVQRSNEEDAAIAQGSRDTSLRALSRDV